MIDAEINKSEAARVLSALGASKGGIARAESLSAEERSAIAAKAARTRWRGREAKPIKATHSGTMTLGNKVLACANLPDGRRVLSERTMMAALGRVYSGYYSERDNAADPGAAVLPRYLAPKGLRPFISDELTDLLEPIPVIPVDGHNVWKGVNAEALPQICDVWLKARAEGVLGQRQQRTAAEAEILVRGLARVGIIALVDEATGFQAHRAVDALAQILEKFVAKELRRWVKTFPTDFYEEMYRLRRWRFIDESSARPAVVGRITDNIVYKRLAPGVRDELRRLTPRDEKGRLKTHLHRRLTEDIGSPRLREHLTAVIALMRASDTWEGFMRSLDRALPKYGETIPLALSE